MVTLWPLLYELLDFDSHLACSMTLEVDGGGSHDLLQLPNVATIH